jgi:hypothetical protein
VLSQVVVEQVDLGPHLRRGGDPKSVQPHPVADDADIVSSRSPAEGHGVPGDVDHLEVTHRIGPGVVRGVVRIGRGCSGSGSAGVEALAGAIQLGPGKAVEHPDGRPAGVCWQRPDAAW